MSVRPRTIVLVSLALALFVGYFVTGPYLYRSLIGLDPTGFPAGQLMQKVGTVLLPAMGFTLAGVVLAFLPLLVIAAGAFFAILKSSQAAASGAESGSSEPDRRSFLLGSLSGAVTGLGTLAVGGAAGFGRTMLGIGNDGRGWKEPVNQMFLQDEGRTHPDWKKDWQGSRVSQYGRLGRTEWKVSDIVMGTGRIKGEKGEAVARAVLERGVNYLDTAPDYAGSGSEQAVGKAIASVPREELFLATKFCSPMGHMPVGTPVARYKEVIHESLQRLGTDYVDLVHIHSCDELDRLLDENVHEAFDQLKQEGKVRFLGFSSHTPNLVQVADAAIESGRFDVMMLAYHHGIWPEIGRVIERAHREQDMGVVAMKTLKGAKHRGIEELRGEVDAYSQAALKWANSNPMVSCAVISFFELQHVDEYLFASGKPLGAADVAVLDKYDTHIAGRYCAPHCGVCLDSCPEQVSINDVLRHRMYFEDYGWEQEGMRLYSQLEHNASKCAECSAPCAGSCPLGIDIRQRAAGAHDLLG